MCPLPSASRGSWRPLLCQNSEPDSDLTISINLEMSHYHILLCAIHIFIYFQTTHQLLPLSNATTQKIIRLGIEDIIRKNT